MRPISSRTLIRILRDAGAEEVRKGKGSHVRFRVGAWSTTVPVHRGEDLSPGLLREIERNLAPCLGKDWLRRRLELH
jgi:predicted RNA binding protein YcfA (HicA-like mRNA interferase family)